MAERVERCETCQFWDQSGVSVLCFCRRYAPRPYVGPGKANDAPRDRIPLWPQTNPDDWCGEWQEWKGEED